MRSLLDINVLIALLDPDHIFHEAAHNWWATHARTGWASCPLTESGVVRIMSNSGYSKQLRFTPADLIDRLSRFARDMDHEFWPDSLTLRDQQHFRAERIHSSRHVTDLYLVGLAVCRGGRFVTFDEHIPLSVIRGAEAKNLLVIECPTKPDAK